MRCTPRASSVMAAAVGALAISELAHADRYEATILVRPVGALGRVAEPVGGGPETPDASPASPPEVTDSVRGAGLDVALSYGWRNWVDVGAELGAVSFGRATYEAANVMVHDEPVMGRVERTTRAAQLLAGAKLRLGVTWVPFLYLGLGAGVRQRSAATLVQDGRRDVLTFTPDGMAAAWSFDLATTVRAGLDRRVGIHWFLGAGVAVSRAVGISAPTLDVVSVSVSCAYSWYPP